MFIIKFCRWRYSNFRPLVSEATALPTEPQDDLSFIITKYHFPSFYAWHSGYLHRWYRKAKVRGFKYLLLGYKSQTKRSAVYTRDQISWLWKDKRLCLWIPAIHHNRHLYIFSCILVIKIFRKKKINKQGGNISHLYCRPHSFFKKWAIPASFSLFSSFQCSWQADRKQMFHLKVCRWPDSNCGSLVSEATALPTEPQALPCRPLPPCWLFWSNDHGPSPQPTACRYPTYDRWVSRP